MEDVLLQINEVIEQYGNTVTIRRITNELETDDWGEPVEASFVDRTAKGVTDQKFLRKLQFGSYGALASASMVILMKAEEDITESDKFIVDGKTFKVLSIEEYKPSDIRLAQNLVLGSE